MLFRRFIDRRPLPENESEEEAVDKERLWLRRWRLESTAGKTCDAKEESAGLALVGLGGWLMVMCS